MPMICSVCKHPNREEIDKKLLARDSLREIASQFPPLSQSALDRHKSRHLVNSELAIVHQETEELRKISINDELMKIFNCVTKLYDACDRWLRDPENPEQYDVGTRSEDVMIHYWFELENGKRVRKKALLSTLLNEIKLTTERPFGDYELIETRHADPRELLVQISKELRSQLEFIAKMRGLINDRPQVNVNVAILQSSEWKQLKEIIVTTLQPYPDAKHALALALPDGNDIQ